DNALEALLNGLDGRLYSAHKKLNEIDKTEAVFKFSTEEIRNRLNALAIRVKEQKDFLKLYLNTTVASRQSLFYKQVTKAEK
ncbi:MAG TPA: hypothetical protein VMY77_18330, partial [Chitinophagaceae bacterium]|nr:hypothetical protein [Chitinophagaceae bacterium]